jgi:hypothetical protein
MADGICALERSVRTVGVFTDGHGRDAVAARSLAVTKAAAFSSYRGFVIGSCHDLWNVEKSFRTSKTGRRPVCHRKRDLIEARLTIVFAALAVNRRIKARTGSSIRKSDRPSLPHDRDPGRTASHRRRPLADDLSQAINAVNRPTDLRTRDGPSQGLLPLRT